MSDLDFYFRKLFRKNGYCSKTGDYFLLSQIVSRAQRLLSCAFLVLCGLLILPHFSEAANKQFVLGDKLPLSNACHYRIVVLEDNLHVYLCSLFGVPVNSGDYVVLNNQPLANALPWIRHATQQGNLVFDPREGLPDRISFMPQNLITEIISFLDTGSALRLRSSSNTLSPIVQNVIDHNLPAHLPFQPFCSRTCYMIMRAVSHELDIPLHILMRPYRHPNMPLASNLESSYQHAVIPNTNVISSDIVYSVILPFLDRNALRSMSEVNSAFRATILGFITNHMNENVIRHWQLNYRRPPTALPNDFANLHRDLPELFSTHGIDVNDNHRPNVLSFDLGGGFAQFNQPATYRLSGQGFSMEVDVTPVTNG